MLVVVCVFIPQSRHGSYLKQYYCQLDIYILYFSILFYTERNPYLVIKLLIYKDTCAINLPVRLLVLTCVQKINALTAGIQVQKDKITTC